MAQEEVRLAGLALLRLLFGLAFPCGCGRLAFIGSGNHLSELAVGSGACLLSTPPPTPKTIIESTGKVKW